LVYSATAKSLRSNPLHGDLTDAQYTPLINGIVGRMLVEPWQLTIAHPCEVEEEVAGFVLWRAIRGGIPCIGYLYVKADYRRRGVGGMLGDYVLAQTAPDPVLRSVLTAPRKGQVGKWLQRKAMRVQLSPYLL
jgi:GNAT superfamily N-acetyltransferase